MKPRGQLLHHFPLNLGSKAQELSGHALVRTEVIFLLNLKFYFFAPKLNIEIEPEKRIRFQKGYCILSFLLGAGPPDFQLKQPLHNRETMFPAALIRCVSGSGSTGSTFAASPSDSLDLN